MKTDIKIGDKFKYQSTKEGVDSFEFTIYQINDSNYDIVINHSDLAKIKKSELMNNVIKL